MSAVDADTTAVIKTFERPQCLHRLLQSLKRYYPGLRVVVVDDSRIPSPDIKGVKVLRLPYDTGLSAGRNAGVDAVDTEFCVMLDDDFIVGPCTGLQVLVSHLRRDPAIDIVGGAVDNAGRGIWRFYGGLETTTHGHVVNRLMGPVQGLVRCDIIPNFFAARTQALRRVRWDPELKLSEHVDFFARAKGVLGVAYCPEAVITHDRRCGDSGRYAGLRGRSSEYYRLYRKKYGFSSLTQKPERSRRRDPVTGIRGHRVHKLKP